jgi:hypothetical protein
VSLLKCVRRTESVGVVLLPANSLDQYKKQTKKWKWSKNLHKGHAAWMIRKANERYKNEDGKETEFRYGGQVWTKDSILARTDRNKTNQECSALTPGMSSNEVNNIQTNSENRRKYPSWHLVRYTA